MKRRHGPADLYGVPFPPGLDLIFTMKGMKMANMEIGREKIHYNPDSKKLQVHLGITLEDGNGMALKAKAELLAGVMNGLMILIEAHSAAFEEKYGVEVMRRTHNYDPHNAKCENNIVIENPKAINQRLLDRAFLENKSNS